MKTSHIKFRVPFTHEQVTNVITGERMYQLHKWGPDGADGRDSTHTVGDLLLYTEDYLDEAVAQMGAGLVNPALSTIRKVAALMVFCSERHIYRGFVNSREHVYNAA